VFNEVSAESLRGLALGIAALPAADRERAQVASGPSAEHAGLVESADVVIADPPRKGLDREVRDALTATPPGRFVYVACGFESFLADATALLASGRFRLSSLAAFDLFPHTEHVEVVALFERTQ
jgi:tRNA/tmRNA/rRNA uracil-C5-methylase (TrmA/RlmC/RlmD family)